MTQTAAAIAKASYLRCQMAPQFFEGFYRHFFAVCPAARPMFAHTDFSRQYKLLQHAVGLLLSYDQQQPEEPNLLERVGERHGRNDLGVNPSHYHDFVEGLILAARDTDPEFTPDTEVAWRAALAGGIEYMKGRA